MPALTAQGFTAIVPDLRGLGESGRPQDSYDVRNVAEDIHQLVAALGFAQIDLVGHDIGAWVAYAYASAYPAEVRRLVVADAGLPGLSPEAGTLVSAAVNVKTWHFAFNTLPELARGADHRARGRLHALAFRPQGLPPRRGVQPRTWRSTRAPTSSPAR